MAMLVSGSVNKSKTAAFLESLMGFFKTFHFAQVQLAREPPDRWVLKAKTPIFGSNDTVKEVTGKKNNTELILNQNKDEWRLGTGWAQKPVLSLRCLSRGQQLHL